MNLRGLSLAFTLLAALACPAFAQIERQADICANNDQNASPVQVVAACNQVISSGRWSGANLAWAYFDRARGYEDQNKLKQANADYRRAIELDPKGDTGYGAYVQRAWISDSVDQAIADLTAAIGINPKRPEAFWRRGDRYTQKKDDVRAIADYSEAIRIDPTQFIYYEDRAQAYERRNDYAHAAADREAIARVKGDDATSAGIYLGQAARNRLSAEQVDLALKDANEGLEKDPTMPPIHDARGLVYLKMGQFAKARDDFDAALKVFPSVAFSFYGRGLAQLKLNELERGNADITKAKKLQPNIADEFAFYGIKADPKTIAGPPPCVSTSAGSAAQDLASIPKCLVVYCASATTVDVRKNLKHIDDMLTELQLRTAETTHVVQKEARACRALNGDTSEGPKMTEWRTTSIELMTASGRLMDLSEALQKPPEKSIFADVTTMIARDFKQPACMAEISKTASDRLNEAKAALDKFHVAESQPISERCGRLGKGK